MTTYELRKIREDLQQSPRSMATHLGINIHTYYNWEKGHPIPRYFAMAVRFLSTQDLPKDGSRWRQPVDSLQTRFSPGARFGHLVVVCRAPLSGLSRHARVAVKCDCGVEKVVRASHLTPTSQCGRYCKQAGAPIPAAEVTPYEPYLGGVTACPTVPEHDLDEPDLDAPEAVWLHYNDRKERQKGELLAAADELNDEAAPCDDLPPLDEEWEEGL